MATGPKVGLYQNAQSASYLPPTLELKKFNQEFEFSAGSQFMSQKMR